MKPSTPSQTEVEKQVAQELKNNRDFIYQTNQALQNLNMGLNALGLQHKREMANYQSLHKSLEISHEKLASKIQVEVQRCFVGFHEMRRMMEAFKAGIETDVKLLDKRIPDKEKIDDIMGEIVNKQYTLDKSHEELACHLENYNMLMKGLLNSEISSVRKDLAVDDTLPERMKEITKELLKSFYVDFQGLVVEIARIRKELDYSKKQFEHIYTLFQRIRQANKAVGG